MPKPTPIWRDPEFQAKLRDLRDPNTGGGKVSIVNCPELLGCKIGTVRACLNELGLWSNRKVSTIGKCDTCPETTELHGRKSCPACIKFHEDLIKADDERDKEYTHTCLNRKCKAEYKTKHDSRGRQLQSYCPTCIKRRNHTADVEGIGVNL